MVITIKSLLISLCAPHTRIITKKKGISSPAKKSYVHGNCPGAVIIDSFQGIVYALEIPMVRCWWDDKYFRDVKIAFILKEVYIFFSTYFSKIWELIIFLQ